MISLPRRAVCQAPGNPSVCPRRSAVGRRRLLGTSAHAERRGAARNPVPLIASGKVEPLRLIGQVVSRQTLCLDFDLIAVTDQVKGDRGTHAAGAWFRVDFP